MSVTGIIMECNPFHRGHQYIIEQAAQIAGKASDCTFSDHAPAYAADHAPERSGHVIVVMSGDFVQRGIPAVATKESRTRQILEAGADLVLELPLRWASSSAEFFARGGIDLLLRTGVVTDLVFGSESGDLRKLLSDAQFLCREPADYRAILKEKISSGLPFPAARAAAAAECSAHIQLPDSANDVLGEEYLKELIRRSALNCSGTVSASYTASDTFLRTFSDIDGFAPSGAPNLSGAPAPSGALAHHPDHLCGITPHAFRRIPAATASEIRAEMKMQQNREALFEDDFSPLLLEKLLLIDSGRYSLSGNISEAAYDVSGRTDSEPRTSCGGAGSSAGSRTGGGSFGPVHFHDFAGVTPDLANRIHNLLPQFISWTQFASLLKSRNITSTAVNRALLHILLDVTKDLVPAEKLAVRNGAPYDSSAFNHTAKAGTENLNNTANAGTENLNNTANAGTENFILTAGDNQDNPPCLHPDLTRTIPYARVLGFRKESASLIGKIRENGLPLITGHADYAAFVSRQEEAPETVEKASREKVRLFPGSTSSENEKKQETPDIALRSLQLDYAASECYDLVKRMKKSRQEDVSSGLPVTPVSEFSKPPVII